MAEKRDLIGYANLAANVVQTAQLDSINSKMREMGQLELQKEYREQQEAALARCEDLLREAVFFYTEGLRDVEEIAPSNPAAAYIRASHLKRLYENTPQIKSSGFRTFEDKERLANMQRAYSRVTRDTAGRLNPSELEECNLCITHLFDRKELVELIEVQKEWDKLERIKATVAEKAAPLLEAQSKIARERSRVEQEASKKTIGVKVSRGMAGVGGGMFAVLVGGMVLFFVFDEERAERFMDREFGWVLIIVAIFFLIGSIGGLTLEAAEKAYKKKKEALEMKSAEITRELAIVNYEVDRIRSDIAQHQSLYAKYGEPSSGDYCKILQERDVLLMQKLGDYAKGFVKGWQAPADST